MSLHPVVHDPHRRPGASQSGDERQTGLDVGQARVDQHHVGQLLLDELERRAHVAGATDHLHLAGHAQQVGQALLDAAIGIDDHHPRRPRAEWGAGWLTCK